MTDAGIPFRNLTLKQADTVQRWRWAQVPDDAIPELARLHPDLCRLEASDIAAFLARNPAPAREAA